MQEGILREPITAASVAASGTYLISNSVISTFIIFSLAFLIADKLNKKYLKNQERKKKKSLDSQWTALLEECIEDGLKTDEITNKVAKLVATQNNEVSSVEINERVVKSLERHIELKSIIFGEKLSQRRLQIQRQRVSDIEKQADKQGYTVSKEVNDEDGVIVEMSKNSLLTTMEDMHQAVIAEENYLHEYLQKFPKIDRVEKDAVLTSSSGHHRADFIATNTQGERYIIELKIARTTGGVLDAERRVKEMFVAVGAEMIGSEVLGVGPLGTSIIIVGKAPSIEEE